MDTEGEGEPLNPNEIELVFKPHPTEMTILQKKRIIQFTTYVLACVLLSFVLLLS